jgi:hypothetical protein
MFTKLLVLIAFVTALGAALLGLRHRQLQIARQAVGLHLEIDDRRQSLWDLQTRIAQRLEPHALSTSLDQSPFELEPIVAPYRGLPQTATMAWAHPHGPATDNED